MRSIQAGFLLLTCVVYFCDSGFVTADEFLTGKMSPRAPAVISPVSAPTVLSMLKAPLNLPFMSSGT